MSTDKVYCTDQETTTTELVSSMTDSLQILLSEYEQCVNTRVTYYVRMTLEKWLSVLPLEDILYAINEAAEAPQPSLRYVEAILRRIEKTQRENPKLASFVRSMDRAQRKAKSAPLR